MKSSTLIAALVVGLFVLGLFTFFASVLVILHGALAGTSAGAVEGMAIAVVGVAAAAALAVVIAADAIAERRAKAPESVPIVTRAIRAAAAWPLGIIGAAALALTGEWAMLAAPGVAAVLMALQFPRRSR